MLGIYLKDNITKLPYLISDKKYNITNEQFNKIFMCDIVHHSYGNIIDIHSSNTLYICGILHLNSNTIYGFNKNDKPYKKFTPNSKYLPQFNVAVKNKKISNDDIYIIIKFEKWESHLKTCYPIGSICRIIGNIGNKIDEENFIFSKITSNNLNDKKLLNNIDISTDPFINDRINLEHKNIFSIDPFNCKDIDDAIHIEYISDNLYELGIHISDVSSYVEIDSMLDNELFKRSVSVYFPNKQINMMPDILSTDKCSLIHNESRRAFSIIINIDISGNIHNVQYLKTQIKCNNLSYEEAEHIIHKNSTHKLKNDLLLLFTLGKNIFHKKNNSYINELLQNNNIYDTHKMIEIFMIMANVLVAKKIVQFSQDECFLRKHTGINDNSIENIKTKCDTDIFKQILTLNISRAEYCVGIKNSTHDGLNETYYTHFTSPIRRYSDIIVHRQLYNIILYENNKCELNTNNIIQFNIYASYINFKNKEYDLILHEYNMLQFSYKMNNKEMIVEGIIVGFFENKTTIYVKEYNIVFNTFIYSTKIQHLINADKNNTHIEIFLKNNNIIKLYLTQLIKLKIVININSPKKILTKIVDPDLTLLF
jgi:exoribonuclease R